MLRLRDTKTCIVMLLLQGLRRPCVCRLPRTHVTMYLVLTGEPGVLRGPVLRPGRGFSIIRWSVPTHSGKRRRGTTERGIEKAENSSTQAVVPEGNQNHPMNSAISNSKTVVYLEHGGYRPKNI